MESRETLHDSSQSQTDTSQTAKTDLSEPAGSSMQAEPLASSGESINPFAPDDGRYVTLEEYWARWYENPYRDIDVSYEWNNGRLEAKPSHNAPQLALCNWFLQLLLRYISTYPIAKLINLGIGFVLTIEDPAEPSGQRKAVRKPDIGVILTSNPVHGEALIGVILTGSAIWLWRRSPMPRRLRCSGIRKRRGGTMRWPG